MPFEVFPVRLDGCQPLIEPKINASFLGGRLCRGLSLGRSNQGQNNHCNAQKSQPKDLPASCCWACPVDGRQHGNFSQKASKLLGNVLCRPNDQAISLHAHFPTGRSDHGPSEERLARRRAEAEASCVRRISGGPLASCSSSRSASGLPMDSSASTDRT